MSMYIPRGAYIPLAEELKKEVNLPVIAGNRLDSWQLIQQCVENGQADIVSLGRPLIADPDLPNKILTQRYDQIRWCLSCNQGCFDSIASLKPVTCTVNARVGKENQYTIQKAEKSRKIMVVGGGVAGMEAARICALRGHDVRLYEKSIRLGGQAGYAASIWGREEIKNIILFLESELRRLNIDVFLDKEVGKDLIIGEAPDVVIIATGTTPILPEIKGINNPNVIPATDVLSGKSPAGEHIVVIGGGSVGCEIAIHLSKQGAIPSENALFLMQNGIIDSQTAIGKAVQGGKKITILEKKRAFGSGIGVSTKWVVLGLLEKLGITLMNEVQVEEISFKAEDSPHNGIVINRKGKTQWIRADSVVIASGYESNDALYKEIKGDTGIEIFLIGDAAAPRNILDAIHEGFELGYHV
jgi:2,4-dienoyl-CoA reductase (NADPH2)